MAFWGGHQHQMTRRRSGNRSGQHEHAFIWPLNGARRGTLGRFTDILTGHGPNMFIVSNPKRYFSSIDGPTHARRNGFTDWELGQRDAASNMVGYQSYVFGPGGPPGHAYDYLTGRYWPVWNGDVPHLSTYAYREWPNEYFMNWGPGRPLYPRETIDPRNLSTEHGLNSDPTPTAPWPHPRIARTPGNAATARNIGRHARRP